MSKRSLLPLFLTLSACANNPPPAVVVETRVEYVYPSAGLLIACSPAFLVDEKMVGDIYTNRDRHKAAYESCESRMKKIINWYNETRSSQNQ